MIIRESFHLTAANIFLPTGKSLETIKDEYGSGGGFPGAAPDTLLVRVPGTHGGFINHNGFFYSQSGMGVGYLTWTQPYRKAVLVNHDEEMTPVGRVVDSRFTLDTPDYYRSNFGAKGNIPTCHIDLILSLTEKDAIRKVMRGEFLTVSQSSICRDIRCSICDCDILDFDNRCDHLRNSKVDGSRVFWKFGVLTYKELSFVTVPSDEFAIIEKIGLEKEEVEDSWSSSPKESYGFLNIMDSVEEPSMAQQKPKADPEDGAETFSAEDVKMIKQLDADVETFMDIFYGMLPVDMADKKLSAAERKALPASAFCGPERSFPVNDCGHVMAARARLKGYKGSGDKTKILACIMRAAKRLNCYKEKDQCTLDEFLASVGLCDKLISKTEHEAAVKKLRDELEDRVKALEDEKVTTTDKIKALDAKDVERLAMNIADIRQTMGSVQDPDCYTATVDAMKERTRESLQDTLDDLRTEIAREFKPVSDPSAEKTKDGIPKGDAPKTQFKSVDDIVRAVVFGAPPKEEK